MRNKYPGCCYKCGLWVPKGEGHFERWNGGWRLQHTWHAKGVIGTEKEKVQKERFIRKYFKDLM